VDDFQTAKLQLILVPRKDLQIVGEYDKWIAEKMSQDVRENLDQSDVVLPLHEFQLPNVFKAVPGIRVLPNTSISSLRTISLPNYGASCVKIPLAIKITGLVRTIQPWAITIRYCLEPIYPVVEAAAKSWKGYLTIVREYTAAASRSDHLGCIIRQSMESLEEETENRIVVCAALVEHIDIIWDETFDKALVMRDFRAPSFRAVLPSVLLHEFALQAHMQNLLIYLDPKTKLIHGFAVRDLGTFQIHIQLSWDRVA
jgi:siderophore synthetase component